MSRLIVKGLPKYLTEDKLKSHFSKEGNVTDVKLMKKRNGESRQFAFIGYKSAADANKAVAFFNRSYIDTAKIEVLLAKTFSDPTVPKAVREKRKLMEQNLLEKEERLLREQEQQQLWKKQKQEHKSKLDSEIAANPKLKEFIETMKPSSQVQSWKNDSLADGSGAPSTKALEEALAKQDGEPAPISNSEDFNMATVEDAASDDEYEAFNKKEDDEDDEEMIPLSKPQEQEEKEPSSSDGIEEQESIAQNPAMSDLDWLREKRVRIKENETEPEETFKNAQTDQLNEKISKPKRSVTEAVTAKPVVSPEEETISKITETGRLFIRNILYDSTEEDFRELFSPFGTLTEVHIAIDTRTGKSKGFVYVQFSDNQEAVAAYRALDKQIFQGRLLHILPGEIKKDHKLDEFAIKNLPLKKQRELKKKAQAGKSQFNWNSLYLNNDAVLDTVALKMGISKAQLIDPQNSSSAVKQALAEAHVIGDVRKYFEEHGVDLTTFGGKERDDKIILVKNLAFGTTSDEIGELFAEYGELKRVLMPTVGTMAIVEFRDAPGARAAFTKLAYRMFKKAILYLEKGPKDLFTREPRLGETVDVLNNDDDEDDEDAVMAKITANDVMNDDADDESRAFEDGPTVSVFVKNLNFSTTSSQLSETFRDLPGFVVALIKTKPDPKDPQKTLSMGFGFVEFRTKENAELAISTYDNHVLNGHRMQLKMSHRKSGTTKSDRSKSEKTNKIIIKNLPFEATRKDVLELFGTYGQVKSVRVPKKFDKSARGFAFVEFTLLKEAEDAMNQLEGVHLLGRRLVMQYAEKAAENAEDEIEKMTQKVRKQAESREIAALRALGVGKMQLEESEDPFNEV